MAVWPSRLFQRSTTTIQNHTQTVQELIQMSITMLISLSTETHLTTLIFFMIFQKIMLRLIHSILHTHKELAVETPQAAQAQFPLSLLTLLVPLKPNHICLTLAATLLFFGVLTALMAISAPTMQLVVNALKHQPTSMLPTTAAITSEPNSLERSQTKQLQDLYSAETFGTTL